MPEYKVLPRIDIREPAFRRYEPYIAKACSGTFTFDPRKINLSPRTFLSRFNDARVGYRRFGYVSTIIPLGYDIMLIEPQELDNGQVRLYNPTADAASLPKNNKVLHASDFDACMAAIEAHKNAEVESNIEIFADSSAQSVPIRELLDPDIFMPMSTGVAHNFKVFRI